MEHREFMKAMFAAPVYTASQQEEIISRFERVSFKKHESLLEEGQIAKVYWFVENGFLRSYVIDVGGNDISTGFYAGGDIVIDWPSFFMQAPTRERVEALSDCVCWQIGYDAFQELFHSIAPFREQGRSNLVKAYFALKNHSIAMIADTAKQRYLHLLKEKPEIFQQVPLKQIATYLGITDTSLSRIRREVAHNR